MDINNPEKHIKGRGAQNNPHNRFHKNELIPDHDYTPSPPDDDTDTDPEADLSHAATKYLNTYPKTFINKIESSDIGLAYSMNPYQGCEHGCIYCYARPSHEFWGYSSGLDFERVILVKQNVVQLLEQTFRKKNWQPLPIMLSGNTDCYQPIEQKLKITQQILQVCLRYKHPVSIITKNFLVTRDIAILQEMASLNLVHVMLSVTGIDERNRLLLEPRTATYAKRFKAMEMLAKVGVPVGVMAAPIIPGFNDHEIIPIIKKAAEMGARTAGYTIVRLNGSLAEVFHNWLHKTFPDRAEKIWRQIEDCHGGQVADYRAGKRMSGEGKFADTIAQMFQTAKKKYMGHLPKFAYNLSIFDPKGGEIDPQLRLF